MCAATIVKNEKDLPVRVAASTEGSNASYGSMLGLGIFHTRIVESCPPEKT